MASNRNQSRAIGGHAPDDALDITISGDDDINQPSADPARITDRPRAQVTDVATRTAGNLLPKQASHNDTQLIRMRRYNFNSMVKRNVELMCEDKVSQNKLEEVHYSLPSSVKSTFIMTFSPDGQRAASTHGDHRIFICDLNTGKLLDTLEGHPKTPWCLAWHPSRREILASGCLAGEVRVWDLRSKACESWTSDNSSIIASLDFHPRERVLVIATANDVHFWDWSESEPFAKTTTSHDKEKVRFVVFDSSGTRLITGIYNLPKYTGYSSDSLQNRIIDSYLTQGTIDQLPTENMTQNSEITSPLSSSLSSIDSYNERNVNQPTLNRHLIHGLNSGEQDLNQRSTLTLSRVAFLYRQLETLEDSMRHTSFSPYIETHPINSSAETSGSTLNNQSDQEGNQRILASSQSASIETSDQLEEGTPPTQQASSQDRIEQARQLDETHSDRPTRPPSAFEPFVVSFDESLEHLQLSPLIIDGQTINLATIVEQYPVQVNQTSIDLHHQLHYMMQFESINQVNQNFIRISKLMSSVRLYRQIVQQILSSNYGQGHYQPNQILTAQSVPPRAARHASHLPIVFRNLPMGSSSIEPNNFNRVMRTTDPILAIQFRNSARNVPLVTVCKIDLLGARSAVIMRAQQLIEQTFSELRPPILLPSSEANMGVGVRQPETGVSASSNRSETTNEGIRSFFPLLNQLHQSLTVINHTPVTTSNVHTHISSLRNLINKLLSILSSMFHTQDEGRRLMSLIHDIANSLTGRSWAIPLGATLDEIRLDVIHTLCIVDLTLHLTRQVQLLQMQRLSAIARIEESRRSSALTQDADSRNQTAPTSASSSTTTMPSTSREVFQSDALPNSKRKNSKPSSSSNDFPKKRRFDEEAMQNAGHDTEMIDLNQADSSIVGAVGSHPSVLNSSPSTNQLSPVQANNTHNTLAESAPSERLVLWNNAQSGHVEQNIQRFLVATASSMSNSHILVRIYHRLHGSPIILPSNNMVDHSAGSERSNLPHESRRRALSQDTSINTQDSSNTTSTDPGQSRQAHANHASSAAGNSVAFDAWQRQPHLHVYQTRGAGQHLWINHWTSPSSISNSNYRLQCWDFSLSAIPNIKDSQSNIITQRCRIINDASVDISSDGSLVACLVPKDEGVFYPNFDLKIFSLKSDDFGSCLHHLPHGPNAVSVSLSPSAAYAVVGQNLQVKYINSNPPSEDDLTIAKVFKLSGKQGHVRDIKIKRDDLLWSLNAIRWLPRGIVYNVGPQHHQRYQATRMRNRVA